MSAPVPSNAEAVATFNRRLGLVLFAMYCLLYAGFIALAVGNRAALAAPAIWGINLAVIYGMGLIGFALFMSVVYLLVARTEPGEEG